MRGVTANTTFAAHSALQHEFSMDEKSFRAIAPTCAIWRLQMRLHGVPQHLSTRARILA